MASWRSIDLKEARKQFAQRLEQVIGDRGNPENLRRFHEKTGRPISKLVSWRNEEHPNWPDVKSLILICEGANVSPTWLLLGKGRADLNTIRQNKNMRDQIQTRLLHIIEGLPLEGQQEAIEIIKELFNDDKTTIDTSREKSSGHLRDARQTQPRKSPTRSGRD